MAEYIEREVVLAEIESLYKDDQKIKTPFAKIIAGGSAKKPYYSIMWWDMEQKECNIGYSSYCLDYVFKWLEVCFEVVDAPAADVAPVVHGRWIEKPFLLGTSNFCSLCDSFYGMPHGKFNYCPNCGARMDGELYAAD